MTTNTISNPLIPELVAALDAALVLCNLLGPSKTTITYDGRSDFDVTPVIRKALVTARKARLNAARSEATDKEDAAWLEYSVDGSMDPSDCFSAGWNAARDNGPPKRDWSTYEGDDDMPYDVEDGSR